MSLNCFCQLPLIVYLKKRRYNDNTMDRFEVMVLANVTRSRTYENMILVSLTKGEGFTGQLEIVGLYRAC